MNKRALSKNQASQPIGSIRKPGLQSKLAGMSEQQKEQLFTWLVVEGLTYKKVIQKLRETFGVTTSNSGLSSFWNQYCAPRIVKVPSDQRQASAPLIEILIQVLPQNQFKISVIKPKTEG